MTSPQPTQPTAQRLIRCAVYTRKSTEEGLQQEFNALDAQREAGEAYIKSQTHEGWTCLPDRFDDGGYTGANMDRPGLGRLLADIKAGRVNAVVVYKVDRLSRSLLDFARLMQIFDDHKVAFVSVTQSFNSATSMGRLVLNVLLSFAQFEREIISERTRDKLAATRRKGKWTGGHPLLGYDLDRQTTKLAVNLDEAIRVRAIFELYLQHRALLPVVRELARRAWVTKSWTNKAGRRRGGMPFDRTNLHRLLANVLYTGQVQHLGKLFPGEHPGIVDPAVFGRVQELLRAKCPYSRSRRRNRFDALLMGILRCASCQHAMTPAHSCRSPGKRYRYYTCTNAQKRGREACPSPSVPAAQIEEFVIRQLRRLGQDPALLARALAEAMPSSTGYDRSLEPDQKVTGSFGGLDVGRCGPNQLASREEKAATARIPDSRGQNQAFEIIPDSSDGHQDLERIDLNDADRALTMLDQQWESLSPAARVRCLHLLIERVDYDGPRGNVRITFGLTGIPTLINELEHHPTERIAWKLL